MAQQTKRPKSSKGRASRASTPRYRRDLAGILRVERLRLAGRWRDAGATTQAMAGYGDMLQRYTGRHAADAAAEELLEMARLLERQGQFYTALAIFRQVDEIYG